jgi:hypothetical protein
MNFDFEGAWKAEETKPVQTKVLPPQQPQVKNPMMNPVKPTDVPQPVVQPPVQPPAKVDPKGEPPKNPEKKKATFNNLFGI